MARRAWDPSKHPRDSRGRFTRSRTTLLSDAETARVRGTAGGFSRRLFRTAADQTAYLRTQGGRTPEQSEAIRAYTGGEAGVLNKALRTSRLDEEQQGLADDLRGAMRPVADDLVLTRTVPLSAFGNAPIEELVGKKVRDAGFTTASLGLHPDGRQNNVTMSVSVPKGTPALFVGDDTDSPDDREVILPDGLEFAVVSATPNDRGGYDMHVVAMPAAAPEPEPVAPTKPPRRMTVAELDAAMQDAITAEDMERFSALAAESDRRDAQRTRARERYAEQQERRDEERSARYDELIEAGWTDEEVVEEVYGISAERQARQNAIAVLGGQGYTQKTFEKLSREAFRDHVYLQWLAAEDATRGAMLNRRARARGVDDRSLFVGPESVARANASEELLAWWDENGRVTLAEFRADLLGDPSGRTMRQSRGSFLR